MLAIENEIKQQGFNLVIGVDEAGRGPLAGPVVATAVALKEDQFTCKITDSKKISPRQREIAFQEIMDKAYVGVGIMNESIIDRMNILQASFLAMRNAVEALIVRVPEVPEDMDARKGDICLLIDGNQFKTDLPYAFRTIVKGDASVLSIACASIVAKVIRDRIICIYDDIFPEYGFRQHKGYPTVKHKQALREYGPSLIHRRSFKY
ncbi:MAG: ribonuclease HII [Candidatus Omnitrophica bacterium]|nr:ribonuclease HII [Candidatus Omnitrophota bacterium]